MLQKDKSIGRKALLTIVGLVLLTSMMALAIFKAPDSLGVFSLPIYMGLVVFIILGYMKLNVDQKRFLNTSIDIIKSKVEG